MNGRARPIRITLALAACLFLPSPGEAKNPVELGKVAWLRGFDSALAEARKSEKALLVLFQEVPG